MLQTLFPFAAEPNLFPAGWQRQMRLPYGVLLLGVAHNLKNILLLIRSPDAPAKISTPQMIDHRIKVNRSHYPNTVVDPDCEPAANQDRAPILAADALQSFQRDGAVRLQGILSPDRIDRLRAGIARNIREPGPFFRRLSDAGQPGDFLTDMWTRERIPEFHDYIETSGVATLAAAALGEPSVRLLQDTWFLKRAGTAERTPWHHDTVVVGPFVSLWVALDPMPRGTSLEFVRRSHRWNRYFMPPSYFTMPDCAATLRETERYYLQYHRGLGDFSQRTSRFEPTPDIEADRSKYDILSWDMDAGDGILFDALTLHGAPGNPGHEDVCRFVTRWIGSTTILAPHGETTIGVLRQHGFDVPFGVGDVVSGSMFPLLPRE